MSYHTGMRSDYAYKTEWYRDILENPGSFKVSPFRLCGNLYFVGNKDSSSLIVDTGECLMLFDTGYPHIQDMLLESIKEMGFDIKDIRMIFHTHAHFDHFGATKRIKELSGAMSCISKVDAALLRDRPDMALCDYLPGVKTDFFTPDKELEDGEIVSLGVTKVRCILTGGHTPGAMSYEITVRDGDRDYKALLCGGVGFNTLNHTFIEETGFNWRGDFERSLEIWKSLKPDIYLGNHTAQSQTLERKRAGRSFVDREAWPEFIARIEKNYHEMLEDEIREEGYYLQ